MPSRLIRAAGPGVLTAGLLAGATGVVYVTGGTSGPWPHLMYLPILLGAARFGLLGGIGVGVAAGLLLGPAMPLEAGSGTSQHTLDWLARSGFFVVAGGLAGLLHGRLGSAAIGTRRSEEQFQALVRSSPDLVLIEDQTSGIQYASPSVASMLGRTPDELVGSSLVDLVHADDRELLGNGSAAGGVDVRARHADGSWRYLEVVHGDLRWGSATERRLITARDVTARRALEAEVAFRSTHDPATGLPVRAAFLERAERLIQSEPGALTMLIVGIDRLGQLSAALGHELVQGVLAGVVDRLTETLPPDALLGHHGEGEFCACWHAEGASAAEEVAEAVVRCCRQPVAVGGREVYLSVSVGVTVAGPARVGVEHLLRSAHATRGTARSRGGNRWVVHRGDMVDEIALRVETETALYRALQHGELRLVYQPIIDLSNGLICGAEALIRWDHPRLGTIAPAQFIPIAEDTGLIVEIGQHVLSTAGTQAAAWAHSSPVSMSVNVSPRQLRDDALVSCLRDLVGRTGTRPDSVVFEITEGCVIDDSDGSLERLDELRGAGARLAIDDFGTGFSSLSYLTQLRADALKIDRVFTRGLGPGTDEERVVSAIIGLARNLGMTTTAEGVETPGQLSSLLSMGCDAVQGYHFAAPLTPEGFGELLADQPFRSRVLSQLVL